MDLISSQKSTLNPGKVMHREMVVLENSEKSE